MTGACFSIVAVIQPDAQGSTASSQYFTGKGLESKKQNPFKSKGICSNFWGLHFTERVPSSAGILLSLLSLITGRVWHMCCVPPQRACQCIPAAPVQHRTRRQGCSQPSRCQGPGADSGCCSGWIFIFHYFWQTRQRQLNGERWDIAACTQQVEGEGERGEADIT